MSTKEAMGKTVEEAVAAALAELGVGREEVEVEVLEEPGRRILGLIPRGQARVRVTVKQSGAEVARRFITDVMRAMGVEARVEVEQKEEFLYMNLSGNNLGKVIGRRGDTLDALQYLLNMVVSRKMGEHVRIFLDAEGYRQRREESLIRLAHRVSERVKRTGNRVVLEPMTPHERRIIHTALQNDRQVYTLSEGEEPYRKVVVTLRR
ncbi:MAG: KH domain-containing protein [Clostridia bacterium]|nr:MAG: KH domain-containing protein [Clostridia bacterium]